MGSALVRDARAATLADPPTAVANTAELPEDVLYEILLRVPAKELCRLRLVCRSWRSLTSDDPDFARAHSSRHPQLIALLPRQDEIHVVDMYSGSISKRIRGLSFRPFSLNLSTQGDLVCFTQANTDTSFFSSRDDPLAMDSQDCILDPAVGVASTLPDGNMYAYYRSTCILGHVPSTGECKVLRVGFLFAPNVVQSCEVITISAAGDEGDGGRRWRRPDPPICVSLELSNMAAIGGFVYFLLGGCLSPDVKHDSVVSFDLEAEEWSPTTIRGPLSRTQQDDAIKLIYSIRVGYLQLAKLNGCLAMIHHDNKDCSMDIWLLVGMDNASWTKRYSILYGSYSECHLYHPPFPLVVLDDERVVVWFKRERVLRAYDPRIGTWTTLAMLEDYYLPMSMYEGSLLRSGLQAGSTFDHPPAYTKLIADALGKLKCKIESFCFSRLWATPE